MTVLTVLLCWLAFSVGVVFGAAWCARSKNEGSPYGVGRDR